MTQGNGVNPAGSSNRLDRIESALEVLIASQQALTARQEALTAGQEALTAGQQVLTAGQQVLTDALQSTNERLDRHEQMITNAVLGYVNMGEALMERIDSVTEHIGRIVSHLDTVSLQVLGLQTENRRILDILQGR